MEGPGQQKHDLLLTPTKRCYVPKPNWTLPSCNTKKLWVLTLFVFLQEHTARTLPTFVLVIQFSKHHHSLFFFASSHIDRVVTNSNSLEKQQLYRKQQAGINDVMLLGVPKFHEHVYVCVDALYVIFTPHPCVRDDTWRHHVSCILSGINATHLQVVGAVCQDTKLISGQWL